jgi:PhzF family phenazine biosynthesis protein
MDQPLTMLQIDAFTSAPFAGNPAGVCFLDHAHPDSWMQSVAAEMNLSETAFLLPEADGYRLRWFTPAAEVRLCGHATLASAHALWETGRLQLGATARFYTLSGLLTAQRRADWIELNFPARPPEPVEVPGLAEALGVKPLYMGKDADDYMV